MSKHKNFKGLVGGMLSDAAGVTPEPKPEPEPDRQIETPLKVVPSTKAVREETVPTSFRLPKNLVARLRAASFWKRKKVGDLVRPAIEELVEKLEKENGGPFPTP